VITSSEPLSADHGRWTGEEKTGLDSRTQDQLNVTSGTAAIVHLACLLSFADHRKWP